MIYKGSMESPQSASSTAENNETSGRLISKMFIMPGPKDIEYVERLSSTKQIQSQFS